MSILALFNLTTGRWIKDADSDDGRVWQTDSAARAEQALLMVNQLKRCNPKHRNDRIEIREKTERHS